MQSVCFTYSINRTEKWNNIYGGSISTVDDNSRLISLTYSGFISMVHRGTISMGEP